SPTSNAIRRGAAGGSSSGGAGGYSDENTLFYTGGGADAIPQPASGGNIGGSSLHTTRFGSIRPIAGGGGGGAGGAGLDGDYNDDALFGNKGGDGGPGLNFIDFDINENRSFAAGGGGNAAGSQSINASGLGGSNSSGGDGSFNGTGLPGQTPGSGGGAGYTGGGNGAPGVVFIRYPNFRILPVEYLYFKADYNAALRSGDLSWATAKEWENDRFEIERSVNNVTDWEKIGEVTGAGYSDGPVEYFYQDRKLPLAGGDIFYRLKQFDFDGDSTYSDIRAIQVNPMSGVTYWRVFPNPTSGDPINLEMIDTGAYNDEEITVRVIAATGVFDSISGKSAKLLSQQLSLILRDKAAGVYTLEISWGENREYHKVILKR
ncbi:T9SS type A sorting domain-containing protein, partial [Algoriphagus sp. NF]|uniref:T9SS type A sorting domain-containing protein n=1 Tax=Algoriphagus sp. NF TaxID=2992756 RepID=UPI00237B2A4E